MRRIRLSGDGVIDCVPNEALRAVAKGAVLDPRGGTADGFRTAFSIGKTQIAMLRGHPLIGELRGLWGQLRR